MDNSVPHPVVRSGAAVGQDSDAHEEDAVSSQVKGHPLVSPNADDSQIMNAVGSGDEEDGLLANEISIHLRCMVDAQMSDVNRGPGASGCGERIVCLLRARQV